MHIKTLTDCLSVSGQMRLDELEDVAKAGFKSIICNRPDGEAADQPTFAELATAAKKAGLESRYIPIVPGQATDAEAVLFAKAMDDLPRPVLAFCRSGARSTMLWEMAQ